jgi:pyrroloquinoline quinone biosynthesis protein B
MNMRIKLLGTAAGGGFPQWNCDCPNCRAARLGDPRASTRFQACVAIGDDDGERWFLVGASPDIRAQLEMLPRPSGGRPRGSVVEGILLGAADLDQVLGLFALREGDPIRVFATPPVRLALAEGLNFEGVLGEYCGVEWPPLPVDRPGELTWRVGRPSGITCQAFAVPGKPPRYRERVSTPDPLDAVGFRFLDERTGGRLIVAPGLAGLDDALVARLSDCDVLLLDGTFWSEHELAEVRGEASPPASAMGHLPVGGSGGSLDRLAKLAVPRKIYLHINNTNPILLDDSPERGQVEAAGFEVGRDGMEFSL